MKKRIIAFLYKIISLLEEKSIIIPKPISSLAPKILTDEEDLERIEPYLCRLNDAVNQKGITNIALTGAYGSGKSTILNTFESKYLTNGESISISLASFKDNRNDNHEGNDDLERELEISILQQLFYHVDPSKIPDSRFKRIINLTDNKLLASSLGFAVWILCALILFKFGYIENLNPATWDTTRIFLWDNSLRLYSQVLFFLRV